MALGELVASVRTSSRLEWISLPLRSTRLPPKYACIMCSSTESKSVSEPEAR